MGKIKKAILKAGFPVSYVQVLMEDGELVVSFPVMGSRKGWRSMGFDPFAGHAAIAHKVVSTMEMDFYCSSCGYGN